MKVRILRSTLQGLVRAITEADDVFSHFIDMWVKNAYATGKALGFAEYKQTKSLKNKAEVRQKLLSIDYQGNHPEIKKIVGALGPTLTYSGYQPELAVKAQQKVVSSFIRGYTAGVQAWIKKSNLRMPD